MQNRHVLYTAGVVKAKNLAPSYNFSLDMCEFPGE